MNVKILAFLIVIYVSGVAPRVNQSENSCRGPMESTFNEVGFLIKIYAGGYISYYLKKMQSGPVWWSNP